MKARFRNVQVFCLVALLILGVSELSPAVGIGNPFTESDRGYWNQMAATAWHYFQPGIGVDARTGLHGAGTEWPYFTEWDLGTYIQAMVNARYLGILERDGPWGFDARVGMIITFLETRKLANNGVPYEIYDSRTGEPSNLVPTFSIDEGKLIMALYNLKIIRPDLTQAIDNVVKVRQNTTAIVPDPKSWLNSTDVYSYYVALAFKAFGFQGWDNVPSSIINTIASQPRVSTYGVELPKAHVICEPLLLAFFDMNPQDAPFTWLMSQIDLAQKARYDATGHYTAFSEGNTNLNSPDPSYVYEYVVDYDGSTWKVAPSVTPIDYLKVAVGFHAIFNSEYTKNSVTSILSKIPNFANGFQEGVAEDGRTVTNNIDRTNGLIIAAARYALGTISSPTPSPSPTPTPTDTPTPTVSDTSTPSDTATPSDTPTPSAEVTPTPTSSDSPTPSTSDSPSPSLVSPSASPNSSASPSPSPSPSPSLSPSATSTPPVGWVVDPTMMVLLVVVAAVAWVSLFIPLVILWRRAGSRSPQAITIESSLSDE